MTFASLEAVRPVRDFQVLIRVDSATRVIRLTPTGNLPDLGLGSRDTVLRCHEKAAETPIRTAPDRPQLLVNPGSIQGRFRVDSGSDAAGPQGRDQGLGLTVWAVARSLRM